MKKQFIAIVVGVATMWSNNVFSYYKDKDKDHKPVKTNIGKEKAASCAPATKGLYLEFNRVKAWIENGGSMFLNRQAGIAAYQVPKVDANATGDEAVPRYAIYAGALWMGGTDVNGQLKLAALRYRAGNDFWSGPLSVNVGSGNYKYDFKSPQGDGVTKDFGAGTITPDQCLAYDKFFTIAKAEVIAFSSWWEYENMPTPNAELVEKPSNDVLNRIENWPAHGDITVGQDYYLAPFYDRDNNGNYNPLTEGDYPWYDDILNRDDVKCGSDRRVSLYGDQTYWWVFNDKGAIHTETNGEPIGMEIRAQAFAFASDDEINLMTFYNYELINRGSQTLTNTYFSQFMDADLGNPQDDYTGCDVSRGLGYVYNGDPEDETNLQVGYGKNPPAIGVDFFEGPYKDADGRANGFYPTDLNAARADSGIVYKGIGIGYDDAIIDNERFGMTRFTYFTGQGAVYPYTDPENAVEYYNFMKGKWANGSDLTFGGQGHDGSVLSTYMFPDDSDPLGWATNGPQGIWNEQTAGNTRGDRRFVQSAGPFTLRPGAVNNITVGVVYARGYDGDLFSSVRALQRADTKAQALFNACFKIFDPPMAPKITIQELDKELIIMLDNPGTSHNNYKEQYREKDEVNIPDPTLNQYYEFEGYQIYQLASSEASISDINDPTKAQLVAQCDKKNGITKIVNFKYDDKIGFSIPEIKVEGENKGIKHTFKLEKDKFTDKSLINNKTYYYVAIAYAYNNYKTYNPTDPAQLDGQKKPYVSSRLGFDGTEIKPVTAMPHNPTLEAGGTKLIAEYGSTPEITRLDGYGNGNRALELTKNSEDYIVQNGYMQKPTYEKGSGPINIKVVDPLNLADGYFECVFDDNGYDENGTNGSDSANWVINRYDKEGGTLLESKKSFLNIGQDNEQVIPQWGISVQINQTKYSGVTSSQYSEPITSSIEFADSSNSWLTGIEDIDGVSVKNWIRAGEYKDTSIIGSTPYNIPSCYKDELGIDEDKLYAKILGGIVAPHRIVGYQCDYMPLAYYGLPSTPGSMRTYAQIAFTPSINIVITSDKSKWTRCPVIELGRDENLNIGGAKPGGLRKSVSVDKDGLPDKSNTTGMGWFPGYAIDLESGARLFMAFGENSFLGNDNGGDMIWNPTSRITDDGTSNGHPILGGLQPVYVYSFKQSTINGTNSAFDFPAYDENNNEVYRLLKLIESNDVSARRQLYGSLTWILNPLLKKGKELLSTDVKIKLRVHKEYKKYVATGRNGGKPMYSWDMSDIATRRGVKSQLVEAMDLINIVPNPYYAYSEYETSRLNTRVKITNLPEKCNVNIYSVNGKLVRSFKKDSEATYLDWDLNNHKGIAVAGGVYLIHVEIPGVGEKVLKFFGGMRQIDIQSL